MSAALAVLLVSPSCSYMQARGADFLDVFTLEASVGPGVHVAGQVTEFFGTGLGYSKQYGVALHGRHAGMAKRTAMGVLWLSMSGIKDQEALYTVVGPDTPLPDYVWLSPGSQVSFMYVPALWYHTMGKMVANSESGGVSTFPRGIRTFDVSIAASALVGVHVGFSPGEFVDFLLGWTTLDIAGDDR